MITRYLIPLLAFIGLIAAIIFSQTHGEVEKPAPNQLTTPPSAPYEKTVSGLGIVEASSRNIAIGSHLPGIVAQVMVREGDSVAQGDPLFQLDDRQAKAQLEILQKDIDTAIASIEVSKAALADEQDQLTRLTKLKEGTTVSVDRLQRSRFSVKRAAASLKQSSTQLESARAQLQQAAITLEQHTVRAPISGMVLKTNLNPGEFIVAGQASAQPVMVLGQVDPLHLRVSIDEYDVWRFTKSSAARASLRSNKDISFPLEMVRIEPYVQPKRNLNGDAAERVDTRVLEVIYSFNPGEQAVYIGQQMDVFIEEE